MKTIFALIATASLSFAQTQYPVTGGAGEDFIPLPPDTNVVAVHPATQGQMNTAYQNAQNYMANQGGYQPVQPGGYIQQSGYQSPQSYIGQQFSSYGRPSNNYQIIPNNSWLGTTSGATSSGMGAYQSAQNGDYIGAAQQGIQAIEQLAGSDLGQKITGSFGNLMNGTLGQAGGSAVGGASGAASSAGGAGGSSGGAAGGAGAAVMDIGSIIQGVLQNMQLANQTQIQSNQLGTLGQVLNVNAKDLAVTKAINGNIGSTQDFTKNQAGLMSSLGNSVNNIFGGGSGGSSAGASGGTSGGMASVMQAGSQVGGFLNNSAGNIWDLFSSAQRVMSVAGNFKNDPIGSARDILSMLFGGSPSNRLQQMSAEEMMQAGVDVPGALAASYNSQILADSKNAVSANQARTQRIQALAQAAQSSRSLSETAAVQTQVGIEQLRNQNEQIGQQATGVSASAANAERAAQLEMERRRLNNAQRLND